MLRIAISFDYDSPAGYRQSFHMRDFPANADYQGAQHIMKVLRKHDVSVTFGVVGHAALPGEKWEYCPDQIRQIHREGHEIASHSMNHRYLPSMNDQELLRDVIASKSALEECIGGQIKGFIPPFNRPSHFPEYGAFSLSETLGLDGRGRGRQSVGSMLRTLSVAGFEWSRVSFQNKFDHIRRKIGRAKEQPPRQPFVFGDVVAIPLHHTGFAEDARQLVRQWMHADIVLTLYGHPNQALSDNSQNARELDCLLTEFCGPRAAREVDFCTMHEVAALTRGECADTPKEVCV